MTSFSSHDLGTKGSRKHSGAAVKCSKKDLKGKGVINTNNKS